MGAKISHFADPLVINIFNRLTSNTNAIARGIPERFIFCSNFPPVTARMVASLLSLKNWIKYAAGSETIKKDETAENSV